jgi:magnesium transporter
VGKRKKNIHLRTAPGNLQYVGEQKEHDVSLQGYVYSQNEIKKLKLEEVFSYQPKENDVIWINLDGIHNTDLIGRLAEKFKLSSLVLEDIVNTGQRPKIEIEEDYLMVNAKAFYQKKKVVMEEHQSFVLKSNVVITFQEFPEDIFDSIRTRLQDPESRLRKRNADYLLFALLDMTVDSYIDVIQNLEDEIEDLDLMITKSTDEKILNSINKKRRKVLKIRKAIIPFKDVTSALVNPELKIIEHKNIPFFKDLHDHTLSAFENAENLKELSLVVKDAFLNKVSYETNKVVQKLTIISTIFIPITFLAGIYGMNFEFMPELKMKYAYFVFLAIIVTLSLFLLYYFKKKKWF